MTILGKHTLAETRDYLAVANYRFSETGKAYDALTTKPDDITKDWETLKARWSVDSDDIANTMRKKAWQSFPSPSSIINTEDEFQRIAKYIQFQENVTGSLQDITKRIETLRGSIIPYSNQPKQDSADFDSAAFKSLDATTKQIDAAYDKAKAEAGKALTSNTGLLIGGSILATLLGIGAVKRYL
jgi:3-methyladenine DNA glycosylase/8-oxoguanine DNA glycosylase